MNLLHPPTSAYFPQDIILRIQAVHLLPEHLRHTQSRECFSILLLLYCSIFAKNNLHRCIRRYCYGGYCMLCKSHSYYLSSFHCFFESISISSQFPYVLRYNVLCDFVSLIFALIRVRNALWEDIIQEKL